MSEKSIQFNVNFIANVPGDTRVEFILVNQSEQTLKDFELNFDFSREVMRDSVENAILVSQQGSHCVFSLLEGQELAPGEKWAFRIKSPTGRIQNMAEMPIAIYLTGSTGYLPLELTEHNLQQFSPLDLLEQTLPQAELGVVPKPQKQVVKDGFFSLPNSLGFSVPEGLDISGSVAWFNEQLVGTTELVQDSENQLEFALTEQEDEAYSLQINSQNIVIQAGSKNGFLYALVSLAQLIQQQGNQLVCMDVEDAPRFGYRGQMLDCCRHFHSIDTVKTILDQMAWLKLNRFHWHLTDDEGWRVEIDAYPQLTEIGAWRGDDEVLCPQFGTGPRRYGGYYTKAEMRDVVAYAEQRGIVVVPEIDVPGHARALIKSLPELLVEDADESEFISIQQYRDNVLNPALPSSMAVLKTILDEVCEIFPSKAIHMGADEVPEGVWESSPAALALAKELQLADVRELQGYFMRQLQDYLRSKGRDMLGWEEAIQGDTLEKDVTIFSWRGVEAGVEAANKGYNVVMTPAKYTYLDLAWNRDIHEYGVLWGGNVTLQTCYDYEPVNGDLQEHAKPKIKGIQAQLWCEYVENKDQVEFLLFPRLMAVAETAWTLAEHKDWNNFLGRVVHQIDRLDRQGINYRAMQR